MSKTNNNSRTKNSALSLLTGVGGQLVNETLRFITRTVFIYTLGKMFLGINGLFSDIMTMLSLTNLGFGTAIIYRLYKPLAEKDDYQVRILLKFYKIAYQSIGAVILVLGLCLLPFLDVVIKDYDKLGEIGLNAEFVYLLFLAQSVCSYFFFAYRNSIFSADQKQYIINSVNIVTNIVCCITQILVLYLWQDFILYLIVGIGSGIVGNLVIAVLAYKTYPDYFRKEQGSLPLSEVKLMLKDCGALFVYKVNGVIQKASGNFILSAFIGLSTVAIYSNYLVVYTAIRHLSNQLFNATKGSMGNLYATSTLDKKYEFFEIVNYITILIFGSIAVNIFVNINELMMVWLGQDYIIPQPYPLLMGAEILVLGLATCLNQIRNITGLFRQMWFRPVLSIIVNLITTLVLVQLIGVYAIPIGYIISVSITNLVADPIVIHKYGFKQMRSVAGYYKKCFYYIIVLAITALLGYYICNHCLRGYGWWSLILHVILCEAITVGILVIVFYRTHECQNLITRVAKIIKRR